MPDHQDKYPRTPEEDAELERSLQQQKANPPNVRRSVEEGLKLPDLEPR